MALPPGRLPGQERPPQALGPDPGDGSAVLVVPQHHDVFVPPGLRRIRRPGHGHRPGGWWIHPGDDRPGRQPDPHRPEEGTGMVKGRPVRPGVGVLPPAGGAAPRAHWSIHSCTTKNGAVKSSPACRLSALIWKKSPARSTGRAGRPVLNRIPPATATAGIPWAQKWLMVLVAVWNAGSEIFPTRPPAICSCMLTRRVGAGGPGGGGGFGIMRSPRAVVGKTPENAGARGG